MKIQISKEITDDNIEKKLRLATIVEDGDYILMRKFPKLEVYDNYGSQFIDMSTVLYIEANISSLKVYTDEGVYDSKLKLYEYLDFHHHFIRINKSTIVNKSRINTIRPGFNMKLLIEVNSKWLEVNRTYYYDFKEMIGI